jgi:predicted dehydrogenase
MSSITRRQFFNRGAYAIAAGGLTLAQAPDARKIGANDKIVVGLIGCGGMGKGDLDCFLANPDVDCAALCDVDEAQFAKCLEITRNRRAAKPETYRDFRRLIDRKDIDAVIVATPDHWHALPMLYACETGKDVYVEKPLAKSIGEGRVMLEAVRRTRRVVQMGTQWRSGEHFREAVEYIQSGKIGKVRMVRAWAYLDWVGGIGNPPDGTPPATADYDMWLGPAPARPFNPNRFHFNFRWYWDYAGGLMTDWGVHLLNVCLWAMGREVPKSVYSCGGKRVVDDNTETPDTQTTVYDFPSYTLIFEHQLLGGVGIGGRPHGMSFSGSEGTAIIDSNGWEVVREPSKTLVPFKKEARGDGRPAHVRNFLDCVKSREQPVENVELGHYVSTIAHLGNLAFRTGKEIIWNAEIEQAEGNGAANGLVTAEYRAPWKLA